MRLRKLPHLAGHWINIVRPRYEEGGKPTVKKMQFGSELIFLFQILGNSKLLDRAKGTRKQDHLRDRPIEKRSGIALGASQLDKPLRLAIGNRLTNL